MTRSPLALSLTIFYYHYSFSHHDTTTKIYIGCLPISIDDSVLREAFGKYCIVVDVMYYFYYTFSIKKGNAQGQFDKFCYGFVTIACDETESLQAINKINTDYPSWKMKIKDDNEPRQDKSQKQFPNQYSNYSNHYQQSPMPNMHSHQVRPSYQNYNQNYMANQSQNDKGEVYGEKNNRIMVR